MSLSTRIRELPSSYNRVGDLSGTRRATRRFQVNVHPDQVPVFAGDPPLVDSVTGFALPRPGDPHPAGGGMIVDTVQVSRDPVTAGALVDIPYSNDRSHRLMDNVDPAADLYGRIIPGFREVVHRIPIQLKKRYVSEGDDAQAIEAWTVVNLEIPATHEQLRVRVNVPDLSSQQRQTIRAQVDRLHFFEGRQWRFMLPDITPNGSRMDITYTWDNDPGTPKIGATTLSGTKFKRPSDLVGQIGADGFLYDPLYIPDPQTHERIPFVELGTIPPSDATVDPHRIQPTKSYPNEDTGHQTLPGIGGLL